MNHLAFSDTFVMIMSLYKQVQYHQPEVFKFNCWTRGSELRDTFSGLVVNSPSTQFRGKDNCWRFHFVFSIRS